MAEIVVTRIPRGDDPRWPMHLLVEVRDAQGSSTHDVTLSQRDAERLVRDRTPEALVRDCFVFLLEREPKESILTSFDVSVIGRYFPEFERTIAGS